MLSGVRNIRKEEISDHEWFEANLDPRGYRAKLGIRIPNLPPDDVQRSFTGNQGRGNLEQAFDFYKFVLAHLPDGVLDKHDILDFGGGWGRVLRFFLREFEPDRLIMVDCLTEAVKWARSLDSPFKVIHTNAFPPLPLAERSVGLCYAFSVFSHLAEQPCCDWLRHFANLLVPGGKLFLTTRGQAQINYLVKLTREGSSNPVLKTLPHPDVIRDRLSKGVFQFYPGGGGRELTHDFFGETWIPRKWMEERYASFGFRTCEFYPEFQSVYQCVFVLQK